MGNRVGLMSTHVNSFHRAFWHIVLSIKRAADLAFALATPMCRGKDRVTKTGRVAGNVRGKGTGRTRRKVAGRGRRGAVKVRGRRAGRGHKGMAGRAKQRMDMHPTSCSSPLWHGQHLQI